MKKLILIISAALLGLPPAAARAAAAAKPAPATPAAVSVSSGSAGAGLKPAPAKPVKPEVLLAGLKRQLEALFGALDQALSQAADELGRTGLKGARARKVLQDLCASDPAIADCAAIDGKGVMVTVEPAAYKSFEGTDISAQEQVAELRENRSPVLSKVFRTVEGFEAADMEYPVFSDGQFAGAVSALLKPEAILQGLLAGEAQDPALEAWLLQPDGRILYHADSAQTGRLLFQDPAYKAFPGLLKLGKQMVSAEAGSGSAEFPGRATEGPVKKEVLWTNIGVYGMQWRLAVTKRAP
ncbi:MAG TPA: hypothetical protein PKI19_06400 [Elusimicrobiales bacterium]|nr:hypothetical protein [Elusimicrobiales bacterium]